MPSPQFTDIQGVVFDAYGTLFDFSSPFARRRDRLGGKADALSELWRRKQLEYSWLRTIMGKYTDFWHVTGEALDYAMAALEIEDPALRAELMQLYLTLDPYPDASATLERLATAGVKAAILSNGSPTMLTAAVNRAGFGRRLHAVISIEETAAYKPHPSVYQLAAERLSAGPANVLFVSANGWDVAGAAAFGFHAVWINRAGAPVERLPNRPAAIVAALADIPALIAAT